MTEYLEGAPKLPLRKEFGIFCFGWIGALLFVFVMALAGFDSRETPLREFLHESLGAILAYLVLGMGGFAGVMIIIPILIEIYDAADWFGRILLTLVVIVAGLTLAGVAHILA